jgi:hypothetical protein
VSPTPEDRQLSDPELDDLQNRLTKAMLDEDDVVDSMHAAAAALRQLRRERDESLQRDHAAILVWKERAEKLAAANTVLRAAIEDALNLRPNQEVLGRALASSESPTEEPK